MGGGELKPGQKGTQELWKKPVISRSIGRQLCVEENEQSYNRKDKVHNKDEWLGI